MSSTGMQPIAEALQGMGYELPAPVAGPIEPAPHDPTDGLPWCSRCDGKRWLRFDVPPGDPSFGRLIRCAECINWSRAERINRMAEAAGLSAAQQLKTFDRFGPVRGARKAAQAAAAFAREPQGILVIFGEPGSGKTHLSLAVANALIQRERPVVWWYVPDLVEAAIVLMKTDKHHDFLRALKQAEVLILDDFGAARATEFRIQDVLEPLFDFRYRNALPTLVTLIGSPEQVKASLSESIGRRMEDETACTVIRNEAPQWRPPDPRKPVDGKEG